MSTATTTTPPTHNPTSNATASNKRASTSTFKEKYVRLNVGGSLFCTTVGTLMKQGDNMLAAMFSGRMDVDRDPEGWVNIDRDGRLFSYILNFLRDGPSIKLPTLSEDRRALLVEAKFYVLDGLMEMLLREEENEIASPLCSVPIITSESEERRILSCATTPVIRLNYNRQNNMFSYTTNSSDNFLRNIELFDKLSLKFNRRILFIKDISCPRDICSWYFYAGKRCIAELCCTSMFYATEKKHTKVEFPESRIFEYTLDILMLENASAPGSETPEYIQRRTAASTSGSGGPMTFNTQTSFLQSHQSMTLTEEPV